MEPLPSVLPTKKNFFNERDTSTFLTTNLYGLGLYKSMLRYTSNTEGKQLQTDRKVMADTYLENDNLNRYSFLCLINLED
jgi:hypothetical protein